MPSRKYSNIAVGMTQIIVRQFNYMQRMIFLGRKNMVSFAIIVHKQGHITSHLSGL